VNFKSVIILSAGHLAVDLNQGALSAMLPFFISAYDLSYTAAATIVFAVNISSSIAQPIFGLIADRISKPWLLPGGLLLAGLGLALTGLLHAYSWILLAGILSGIGIAAYHPEAARLVNLIAGPKKSSAMSIFGVGGTAGFALGPILITAAMLKWGLPGSLSLLFPALLMALLIVSLFSWFKVATAQNVSPSSSPTGERRPENWSAFARVALLVSGRSVIFFGLNIFIPLYWIKELGQSEVAGATALSLFATFGIIGNLTGGHLADRIGLKRVIVAGFLCLSGLLPVLTALDDPLKATVLLAPIGFMVFASFSPTIVLGQRYLPNRIGFSSGITLGLAIAIGGGTAPFLGKLADIYGVWTALAALSALSPLLLLVAFSLPSSETPEK